MQQFGFLLHLIIITIIIIIIIIIITSEYFHMIKVSVLYKYIQVKNCYQHLPCVKPLSKKGGRYI